MFYKNQNMIDIPKLNKSICTEVASTQNRYGRLLSLKTEEMKQILTTVKKTKIKQPVSDLKQSASISS